MSQNDRKRINLTLGLCIAGGLTAGVALARPASDSPTSAAAPATAEAEPTTDDGPSYEYPSVQDLTEDAAPASAEAEPAAITIADFAFGDPITVAPGTEIVVTNVDGAPHSVTASDGAFDSGVLGQDEAASIVAPDAAGTYAFFCTVHPSMQGELVVS